MSKLTVVIGSQWGDEGKGKLVDKLAETADLVCRCQGGNNAGHTVVVNGVHFFFHLIPSGVTNTKSIGVIGNGVVVHLDALFAELDENKAKGLHDLEKRLKLSPRCHIVCDIHQKIDGLEEELRGSNSIGTTRKGIGPCYSSKVVRNGIRIADLLGDWDSFVKRYKLLVEYAQRRYNERLCTDIEADLETFKNHRERIRPMVCDTVSLFHGYLKQADKNILVEGAQSCMLDIDFGTYPFVTSSNCSVGGVCTGLGVPPNAIGAVYGVVKAYTTRVGGGNFPTEILDTELAENIRKEGHEYGVTTGRPRRIGWIDVFAIQYTMKICGYQALALTKLDILDNISQIKIGVSYRRKSNKEKVDYFPVTSSELDECEVVYEEVPGWSCSTANMKSFLDLPKNAQNYVLLLEKYLQIPIRWVGTGPSREALIDRGLQDI